MPIFPLSICFCLVPTGSFFFNVKFSVGDYHTGNLSVCFISYKNRPGFPRSTVVKNLPANQLNLRRHSSIPESGQIPQAGKQLGL